MGHLTIRKARLKYLYTTGYGKIEGELIKLDFKVSQSTIRNVLNRHNILPALVRSGSISWRLWMGHYKEQILSCEFFTIETIRLQTIYVLFFIELGSRRVHLEEAQTIWNDENRLEIPARTINEVRF